MEKIKNFDDLFELEEEQKLLTFTEAFEKYVKGQIIMSDAGDGIILKNGYKYEHFGGGCSGEDCNTTYIFDPDGKLVAKEDW